jgi:hypothetical protein
MLPVDREIASYVFSEKVNYLAHVNMGKRQRAIIVFLLAVSAVLSSIAGAVGLSDMSKSWVSGVALAAGATSVLVLAAAEGEFERKSLPVNWVPAAALAGAWADIIGEDRSANVSNKKQQPKSGCEHVPVRI